MIYQQSAADDLVSILHHINSFAKGLGVQRLDVDTKALEFVCYSIRTKFPCVNGLANASVFKKVANFVAWFIAQQPVKTSLTKEMIGEELACMDLNAIIAFDIALTMLHGATIYRRDRSFTIDQRIYLSNHSYLDIIDALSTDGSGAITPQRHFKLLSILFEQLVYKTNPGIQYTAAVVEKPEVYPIEHSVSADYDSAGV